ncbi:Hachiman antiphage defense system protein HamA [Cryobacterium sp. TMT3-29-2]|uniref:Hachiman antiphage defense system protein HamA n=1 Tax=Cryobacterium sp. TMT3-29-2 TaxID=2555867 RepID=UPI001074213A|nr:Hachiman antiphage defense system protein HamA [Cryobacterium sp. TMT3-29-2]TFC86672.1 DUF1837 domain-containing protein [Cryobacterium sp. TMT3-29-2]
MRKNALASLVPPRPAYLKSLVKQVPGLVNDDGHVIDIWTLCLPDDATVLSDWAAQFRQNYCLDDEIDELRDGTGLSRRDYLLEMVFPAASGGTGPATRSGDFAELLVSDYVEHVLGFWVPRLKYADKTNPSESMKGVDVVGFLQLDTARSQPDDQLLAFEVKARLSSTGKGDRLQDAIKDSGIDFLRLGYTLNKAKRLLRGRGDRHGVKGVARFQNKADRPFELLFGAGAVLNDAIFDTDVVQASTTDDHPHRDDLQLMVVRGADLMNVAHAMYLRAADEA